MKKVFLSLAVLFSVALVSCGGNKAEKEAEDSMANEPVVEEVAVVDAVIDTNAPAGDTTVAVEGEGVATEAPAAN